MGKISKIFRATSKDVASWQKHRVKTSVINQLVNWQKIDHINLQDFVPSSERVAAQQYNQLLLTKNFEFFMKTIEKIFNGTTVVFETQKRSKSESNKGLTAPVYNVVSIRKGIGGIERDIKVSRVDGAKVASYESESKGAKKNVLYAVYKDGTRLNFGETKDASILGAEALKAALAAQWGIDVVLLADVNLSDALKARAVDDKAAQLLYAISKSSNFIEIAQGVKSAAAVVAAENDKAQRMRKNKDIIEAAERAAAAAAREEMIKSIASAFGISIEDARAKIAGGKIHSAV